MAFTLSLQDVAIAAAIRNETLTCEVCVDRWGDSFIAIKDEHGTIEVADDHGAAMQRILEVQMRIAQKEASA